MTARGRRYRVDVAAYERWLSARRCGSCQFTEDDELSAENVGAYWAYNVTCKGQFVSVYQMPKRFLKEITDGDC